MMSGRSLSVSYDNGRALAAYLYLPRRPGEKSARTQLFDGDFVVDFGDDGRPIGVEIISPDIFSLDGLNRVFASIGLAPATALEVRPLLLAQSRDSASAA